MDPLSRAQALFTLQVDAYVAAGYADMTDFTEAQFRALLEPLRAGVDAAVAGGLDIGATPDHAPFAIVVTSRVVSPGPRVAALRAPGRDLPGAIDPGHRDSLDAYEAIPGLEAPDADAYLLLDVDRGDGFREITPDDAVGVLADRDRTPLTLDEGLSLAAVHPGAIEPDAGFLFAGSRHLRRVPGLWIAAGAPMLGWGGVATPDAWLGVASATSRVAA